MHKRRLTIHYDTLRDMWIAIFIFLASIKTHGHENAFLITRLNVLYVVLCILWCLEDEIFKHFHERRTSHSLRIYTHDAFTLIHATWLIHMRDMTHSCVSYDSSICVRGHICMHDDRTHSFMWHDPFTWIHKLCHRKDPTNSLINISHHKLCHLKYHKLTYQHITKLYRCGEYHKLFHWTTPNYVINTSQTVSKDHKVNHLNLKNPSPTISQTVSS